MNRKVPSFILHFCCAVVSVTALADIVTLKSGEKVEGKITAETDAEITINAKVSAGIFDEQTIKKSDVASVTKDAPDEIAWQPLKNLKPGNESLPAASYDAILNSLKAFTTEFSTSKFSADAQKIADTFSEEKKRVAAGEVKLGGKWLSKDEVQKERYQVEGTIAFNFMKEQSTRDLVGALNTFDLIEKKYPGARSFPDAVAQAQAVLAALKAEVERRKPAAAAAKAERDKQLQVATGAQRTEMQAVNQREQAVVDAAMSMADKQGLKWPPLIATSERSLQTLESKTASETGRLRSMPIAKMRESIQSSDKARTAFDAKDFAGAEESLNKAADAWSANEVAVRLRQEIQTAKTAAATAPPPEPAPAAVPTVAKVEPRVVDEKPAVTSKVDDEAKPFLLTPLGAITVVLTVALLAAVVNVFKKLKGRANEVLE